MSSESLTLMAVHAHPDDESSSTGGVLRLAAEQGHTTVLVTCTNGELGEVNDPSLQLTPLESLNDRRALAQIRRDELAQAAAVLGITHVHLLGYHDSGMHGWETNHAPQAFRQANPEEVTARLVGLIRHHRPHIVITYDQNGGYGHPDHIMTHLVTMAAVHAAADVNRFRGADAPWQIRKLYYTAWARSEMLRAFKTMHRLGLRTPLRDPDFDPNAFGCPDELITARIDIRPVLRTKWRALFSHRSQMGRSRALRWFLHTTGRWLFPHESFQCVHNATSAIKPETDLFCRLQ